MNEVFSVIGKEAESDAFIAHEVWEALGIRKSAELEVLDVGVARGGGYEAFPTSCSSRLSVKSVALSRRHAQEGDAPHGEEGTSYSAEVFEDISEDHAFDMVVMRYVLAYASDRRAMIEKAHRLLKPGGFLVTLSMDYEAMVSYPDPEGIMRGVVEGCIDVCREKLSCGGVRGCSGPDSDYALLREGGFRNTRRRVIDEDADGLPYRERIAHYERFLHRITSVVEPCMTEQRFTALISRGRTLFDQEEYYLSVPTVVMVGQRLGEGMEPRRFVGSFFRNRFDARTGEIIESGTSDVYLRPMVEQDLGRVMHIETESFPSPWTTLAYVMEMRYNEAADYRVLVSRERGVIGYIGVWKTGAFVHVIRLAVDRTCARRGWGTFMIGWASRYGYEGGYEALILEVRASNEAAVSFYTAQGFSVLERVRGYYTDPDEDAFRMVGSLEPEKKISE